MLENAFDQILDKFIQNLNIENLNSIAVCYSGGIDSSVLLDLCNKWCKKNVVNLVAIHVDHKLRANSSKEAAEISQYLTESNIKSEILVWNHANIESRIQQSARIARYELISEYCIKNKIDLALTAHHLNDQIEQIIISLSQGAGIYSFLIPETNQIAGFKYARPFLEFQKSDLINYLNDNHIKYWDDYSNSNKKYLRNNAREIATQILELSQDARILTSIKNIKRASASLSAVKDSFIVNEVEYSDLGYAKFKFSNYLKLEDEIRYSVLREVLLKIGRRYNNHTSNSIRLDSIINLDKSISENYQTLAGCSIVEDSDYVVIFRDFGRANPKDLTDNNGIWDNRFYISSNQGVIKNLSTNDLKILLNASADILDFDVNLSEKLKKKILMTLPCLFILEKLVAMYHIYTDIDSNNSLKTNIKYIEA
jgi:tRNA(Ile)-lysidine synthase